MSEEKTFLTLVSNSNNSAFVFQTYGMADYVFFDKRLSFNNIAKASMQRSGFDFKFYEELKEKCLKIENEDVKLILKEFLVFAKLIDFVSKCFLGDFRRELELLINSDFPGESYDFSDISKSYLTEAKGFFASFKKNCTNIEILDFIKKELDYF